MSDEEQTEGEGYGLVMPFVLVESKGGRFEDEAFTAGWALGALDYRLSVDKHNSAVPGSHYQRVEYQPQADLIAMRHGFTLTVTPLAAPREWWGRYDYERATEV